MDILMIVPEPFLSHRGTPLSVLRQLEVLARQKHSIDVVTYHLGEDIHIPGVTVHRIWSLFPISEVKKSVSFAKILLDPLVLLKAVLLLRKKRFDCIHALEEGAFLGAICKKLFHIPLLYDMDSNILQELADAKSFFWRNPLSLGIARRLIQWMVRQADLVVAVSPRLREEILEIQPQASVEVLLDPPTVPQLEPGYRERVNQLRQELKLADKKIVLYTGSFDEYQGVDVVVRGLPYVAKWEPEAHFILVGGEPTDVDRLRRLAQELGVADRVSLIGRKPIEEMPIYLEVADILVSPRISGSHNIPIKIFAYLQAGKPIVATNVIAHTQVLTGDVALLVPPDEHSLAEGILRLLKDKELGRQLSTRGKALVDRVYSCEAFSAKVGEIYTKLEKRIVEGA